MHEPCLSPYDIGHGITVKFDHDFVGRTALEAVIDPQRRTKVTLVWDTDDVRSAMGSLVGEGPGAKYMDLPKIRYAPRQEDKVLLDGRQVGVSLDCGYVANQREVLSLATIDAAHAEPGTRVTVLWGEEPNSSKPQVQEHKQVEIRATVASVPYVQSVRDNYRAP